jgi:tetratricopeptide (TPR) repeat protein
MKAQHRKELETNALADRLGGLMHGLKEAPSRGTLIVGGLVVLAVALVVVWRLVAHSTQERTSERWLKLYEALGTEELKQFVKENPDKPQARVARFELARRDLYQGLRDLGSSLAGREAVQRIRDAAAEYDKLAKEAADTPSLARAAPGMEQEALLNAGKAYEALGDLRKAREMYGRVAKSDPQGPGAKQLARLDSAGDEVEQLKKDLVDPVERPPAPLTPPL